MTRRFLTAAARAELLATGKATVHL